MGNVYRMLTVTAWSAEMSISKQAGYSAVKRCGIPVVDGKVDADLATHLYRQRTRYRVNAARMAKAPRRASDPVAAVEQLNVLLRDNLDNMCTHADIVPRLQAAMRAVPPHRRHEVNLFLGNWVLLLGCWPTLLEDDDHDQFIPDDKPWYSIAAGENFEAP